MIVTVTPNPALDITHEFDRLIPGSVHRAHRVTERPGGKGLNVASVLAQLGEPVCALGFLGGLTGQRIADLACRAPGIRAVERHWVACPAESRRTLIVVAEGEATVFNEPGRPAGAGAWQNLGARLAERVRPGDVVAFCGSVPPGTPAGSLAGLLQIVALGQARSVVDSSGRWLAEAARTGAGLLKPNHLELAAIGGSPDPVVGARRLIRWGARAVAVSCGAKGMGLFLADRPDRYWLASGPALSGNPTGAGDAAVAAWCRVLAAGQPLRDVAAAALRDAVALSGAAVCSAEAGTFDPATYRRLIEVIEVTEVAARPSLAGVELPIVTGSAD